MAATKSHIDIWSGQTLTAGAADTDSGWKDLSGGHGAALNVILTNGATGPTVAAQVQVVMANDWNAGAPTQATNSWLLKGNTDNNGVAQWAGITIPRHVQAVKLVAGSNTGQDVTVDADLSQTTALS